MDSYVEAARCFVDEVVECGETNSIATLPEKDSLESGMRILCEKYSSKDIYSFITMEKSIIQTFLAQVCTMKQYQFSHVVKGILLNEVIMIMKSMKRIKKIIWKQVIKRNKRLCPLTCNSKSFFFFCIFFSKWSTNQNLFYQFSRIDCWYVQEWIQNVSEITGTLSTHAHWRWWVGCSLPLNLSLAKHLINSSACKIWCY